MSDNMRKSKEADLLTAYESESDELFSDEEQKNEIKYKLNGSQNTLNKSETCLLSFDHLQRATSSNATVPSTPLSLLPLLSKINEQWSSDLETPQGKQYSHTHMKPSTSITINTEEIPREQYTPDVSAIKCIVNKITPESPVILTRDVIKRSKRRIFKSSTSTDSSALNSNENITMNMQIEVREPSSEDSKMVVQSNSSNVVSISSVDDIFEENVSTVPKKFQDMHNSDMSVNIMSDSSNTLSEELLKTTSFNNIDNIRSNNLDKLKIIKSTIQCDDKQNNKRRNMPDICDLNEIQENKDIGFFTASGTPIHISKEALAKVKTLFANDFDKEENKQSAYSIVNNISIDNVKEKFLERKVLNTEHAYDKAALIKDCTNLAINKNFMEDVNISPPLFSIASDVPADIAKKALSKPNILAKESDNDNDIFRKNDIFANKNFIEQKNKVQSSVSITDSIPISISKKSLIEANMFAEQLSIPVKSTTCNKVDISGPDHTDVKDSSMEFETTSDISNNTSNQAKLKAEVFPEQLNDPMKLLISREDDIINKEIKEQDVNFQNIGFQTARGAPINISNRALSKAKILFAEQLDSSLSHSVITEKMNDNNKEIKISNTGFQTARGASINISKQALSKAKMSFAEQSDETLLKSVITKKTNSNNEEIRTEETKVSNIGFQTAHGTSIHISEQALSKAKILFAEQLDDPLSHSVITEKMNDNNKEIKISNTGFQTARGASISISKQALSKAKMSFAEQSDETLLKSVITKKTNINNEDVKREEAEMSTIGFQTARGVPINISEQALLKAKISFTEQLDTSLETVILENNKKLRECNLENSYDGFQTTSGQHVTVSNNALLKARQLFSETPDKSNCGMSHSSFLLQKRKLNSDESTPPSRNYIPGSKKVRLNNEFQARKLFSSNSDTKTDSGKIPILLSKSENICNTNKMLTSHNDNCNKENYTAELSSEVATNIAIDIEQNQTNSMDCSPGSPKEVTLESNELHSKTELTGSPIIGRQAISRKRKIFGHRRDKRSALYTDKITPPGIFREKFLSIDTSSREINETENIVVQKPCQVESQNIVHNSTDSSEYGDTQIMMDFIDESAKILQNRLTAALDQEKLITMKKKHRSKQQTGSLYRYKQIHSNNRLSLREISNGVPPVPYSYQELIDQQISPNILTITATTAISYKFRCSDFYGSDIARSNIHGIEMEDGVRLILDENGYVGVREFHRAFLAGATIDPNLVPAQWVENHYRWIVWKLASMDRMKFGSVKLPRTLTPSRVMAQLKYRYDREIDRSQRPAIRRILEKDGVASKRIILCVSSITENNNAKEIGKNLRTEMFKWKIELTDGWYSIQACVDVDMIKNISNGKVREGTKLITYGAELLNCDQGCYPLEAPSDIYLKLHTNSTRRTRWDTKLGYTSHPGPIPIKLHNVCPNGGLIGKMTVIVARVYPMLYHERTTSGESIIRNIKCEEKACIEYEKQCRLKVETFYDKAEKNFKRQELSSETDNIDLFVTQLSKDCERSSTEEFRLKEERFQQKLESELRESMPAPRQVSPLLKVRVCDQNVNAILSIWSPSEEVTDIFKEGACVSFYNVVACGKRGCELQLTARRMAIFRPGTMHDMSYPLRTYTSFSEIGNPEFAPPHGEFDTVGFVCSVGPAPFGMKNFEVVHLAYVVDTKTDLNDSLYLSILFWQGTANYGYAEILTVGSIVACSNLEWRRATSWNVPVAYCTEKSIFTRNPRRNHLHEPFETLKTLITDPVVYAKKCMCELNKELQKKPMTRTPMRYTLNKNTPDKMVYNPISSSDKRLIDYTSPVLNSSIRDANISRASTSSIQRRLDKLKHYGEPPELSPIILRNSSSRISLDFRSPMNTPIAKLMKSVSDITKSEYSNSNSSGN